MHSTEKIPLTSGGFDLAWANQLTGWLQRWTDKLKGGDINVHGNLITEGGRREAITLLNPDTLDDITVYQILSTDHIVDVNVPNPITLTLPRSPAKGMVIEVWDSSGAAVANPISILPSDALHLNGDVAPRVISTNYGHSVIRFNGTQFVGS